MNETAARPTILIVDDDVVLARAYALALGTQGYAVKTTHTAEDAMNEVRMAPPDAIILDYRMPLINGAGFLYRLRSHGAAERIPVLVITGETSFEEEVLQELKDLGAQIRQKPIGLDAFLAAARELVSRVVPAPATATLTRRVAS
jgi:DNA-binding response OmpR family regulator